MGEAGKSFMIGLAAAVGLCFTLTACSHLPFWSGAHEEDPALNAEPPVSLSGDMGDIDREISLASSRPEALVGENSMGVSELSEDVEAQNDPLALSEVPSELLGHDESQIAAPSFLSLPKPGSSEERRLASMHTRQNLCTGSDTLCITSPYGVKRSSRRSHKGIDIRAPMGSPIMAFRSGVVVRAEYHHSYGYMVEIQQSDGLLARYAHMSQILVSRGAHVQPGLMIGRVGSTGRSTGPHLHFELLRDNRQMNPMAVLPSPKQVVTKATPADMAEARKAMSARKKMSKKAVKKTGRKASAKKTSAKKASVQKTSAKTNVKKTSAASSASKAPAAKKGTVQKTVKKTNAAPKKTTAKNNSTVKKAASKTNAAGSAAKKTNGGTSAKVQKKTS